MGKDAQRDVADERSLVVKDDLDPSRSIPAEWYERDVVDVARDLLGCLIVSTAGGATVAGVIVETEAYDGEEDPACHSSFRRNGVVRAMWGPRGSLYVYRAYGMYPCFNVVAGPGARPAAVLVRALSPAHGVNTLAVRAGRPENSRVASGPGLAGRALGIDLTNNGHPLQINPIWIQPGERHRARGRRSAHRRHTRVPTSRGGLESTGTLPCRSALANGAAGRAIGERGSLLYS